MNINDTDLGGFTPSQQEAILNITPAVQALDNMNRAGCLPPLAVSYFMEILKGIEILAVDLRDDNDDLIAELADAENALFDVRSQNDRLQNAALFTAQAMEDVVGCAEDYREQRDALAAFIKEMTGAETIGLFALDADAQALPVATL